MFLNHFMTKTVRWNHSDGQKQKTSPWITKSLKNACKKKDTLSRKWQCIELYHTHTHTCRTHTHIRTHMQNTHTDTHTDTHIQIQNIRTYRYRTYTHTYTHIFIHTHTHTHTHEWQYKYICDAHALSLILLFFLVFSSCLPSEDNLFSSKASVTLFCNSRLMICHLSFTGKGASMTPFTLLRFHSKLN